METECEITSEEVRKLLKLFSSLHYKTRDKRTDVVQQLCTNLFKKDYKDLAIINNENGELAASYPSKIIIPHVSDQNATQTGAEVGVNALDNSEESDNICVRMDVNKLKELMSRARVARCRARFPIPVIYFNGKYVCRSATLSGGPEIYGRSGLDYLFNEYSRNSDYDASTLTTNGDDVNTHSLSLNISDTSHLFSRVRNQDIKLLKYLSVGYICDLMVEKKKVKFGMNVTSSEKADKESRYSDFNIMSLPYPGCEFFRDYRDNEYSAEGLVYDWNQHFVDAHLIVPNNDRICDELNVDWKNYRSWDVIKLTQNYLKLLLLYMNESNSSILIHCISGWDRTPLFTSLLRLSLWADGKIHQKLSPYEITFLTIAYDWFLFGHNLTDRLSKGEEILFFCFYFLKFFTNDEYSIDSISSRCSKERKPSVDCYVNGEETPVLLEENQSSNKYGGSSTSLNSSCSSASNRSHDNNCPPMYFSIYNNGEDIFGSLKSDSESSCSGSKTPPTLTNSEEGSVIFANGITSTLVNSTCCGDPLKNNIQKLYSNGCQKNHSSKMTEPVAIPNHKKVVPINDCCSPSLSRSDSWQLVSDTGSIREYPTMRCSCHSPDSLSSPKTIGNVSESESTQSNSNPLESKESKPIKPLSRTGLPKTNYIRKERLQAVRSIFYNAYSAAIGFKFKNGSDNPTGLSSLIDHFAGTVGIYSSRVTAPQ